MISEVLNLICSRTISLYSQCSQVVLPKKHLKVPESCRSDVGYLWLYFTTGCLKETEFYQNEHLQICISSQLTAGSPNAQFDKTQFFRHPVCKH